MTAVLPGGSSGGSQTYFAHVTVSGGAGEGGEIFVPLVSLFGGLGPGGSVSSGIPFARTAGQPLDGHVVVDPAFASAHTVTVFAAIEACNADSSELLSVFTDVNVPVNVVTGVPVWADSVWDEFTRTGADLSIADGGSPRIVTAAGGKFLLNFYAQFAIT